MRKTWTRVITGILLLSLIFSITACQRKRFTLEEFVEISNKNGIDQVSNLVGSEEYKIVEMSKGTTDTYTLQYVRYTTVEEAKAKYNSISEGYNALLDDPSGNEVTVISTEDNGMQRMVVSVTYTDDNGKDQGVYAATVLVDDVLIDMAANGNDMRAIEKIDGILKDLGYYY